MVACSSFLCSNESQTNRQDTEEGLGSAEAGLGSNTLTPLFEHPLIELIETVGRTGGVRVGVAEGLSLDEEEEERESVTSLLSDFPPQNASV